MRDDKKKPEPKKTEDTAKKLPPAKSKQINPKCDVKPQRLLESQEQDKSKGRALFG